MMLNIASSGLKRRPLQAGGLSISLGLLFIAEESRFDEVLFLRCIVKAMFSEF